MTFYSFSKLKKHNSWNMYVTSLYTENEYKPMITAENKNVYKCIWGVFCKNEDCIHLHPSEYGYVNAPYFQNEKKCLYESETTCCRIKCGNNNGRYCPFTHCSHSGMEYISMKCPKPDCQRHCPKCF